MVIRQGMTPVLAGALVGGRALRSLLSGIEAGDPATLAAVTGFLVAVSLAAIFLPARRAARSDPMLALRND